MIHVLGYLMYLILMFLLMFWRAFVGIKMWNLLILPLDPNFAVTITVGQVACILMMFTYIKGFSKKDLEDDNDENLLERLFKNVAYGTLTPVVSLVFAWILSAVVY